MKKPIFFTSINPPRIPIQFGIILVLCYKVFDITQWLLGILIFVYICYFIIVMYVRYKAIYLEPFDEITIDVPLDQKIKAAIEDKVNIAFKEPKVKTFKERLKAKMDEDEV